MKERRPPGVTLERASTREHLSAKLSKSDGPYLAFDIDLMYTSAPFQESKAPGKHTIQSKQSARSGLDLGPKAWS